MFSSLHPILILIYIDMFIYARDNYNVELVITDTVSSVTRDKLLRRKSPSHREHRALDIRTKDVDLFVLMDIVDYVNDHPLYQKHKYLSSSGEKRLAYYHIGTNEHIHLAIHSRYKVK